MLELRQAVAAGLNNPTSGRMLPAPKPKEPQPKRIIFSISHQFTENWIRLQQIAKLIGRKK
jgi:hypothetical protein